MRYAVVSAAAILASVAATLTAFSALRSAGAEQRLSPIYGVALPEGYRRWQLIAPSSEGPPLNELRSILANERGVMAYQSKILPFPDGTVLVKLAWKRQQLGEFASATVPGDPTTVQVMVKDSKRYAASGGWGFGRFVNGKPVDRAQHETCLSCHQQNVKDHDIVFTRYAS